MVKLLPKEKKWLDWNAVPILRGKNIAVLTCRRVGK